MNPIEDKDDTTYVQMHSAVSQADAIRNSLMSSTSDQVAVNGVGPRTFTNTPSTGEHEYIICCVSVCKCYSFCVLITNIN